MGFLIGVLPLAVWVLVGFAARSRGLLSDADARHVLTFVKWTTLPAVWLQTFNRVPTDIESLAGLLVAGLVCCAATAYVAWFVVFQGKPLKDRAWLTGGTLGLDIGGAALPVVGSLFGLQGLWAAGCLELANGLMARAGSFLLQGSTGTAFPSSYAHEDGGTFSGEWDRMKKTGLGVYRYAGGQRYEGEWRDNLKDGRGVYYFAKGGVYEGEWSQGERDGIGVHTFSSGKVKAGRWSRGRLEVPLELWQCSGAVEGSLEAAAAARSLQLGGATPAKALQEAASQAPMWALAAGLALSMTDAALPLWADGLSRQLASIHLYLSLIALGASWIPPVWTASLQEHDAAAVIAVRCGVPLLMISVAATLMREDWWLRLVACVGTCLLAPLPPWASEYAVRFRLAGFVPSSAMSSASAAVSLPLMLLVAGTGASAPAALPRLALLLALLLGSGAMALRGRARSANKVKMTFRASQGQQQQQPATTGATLATGSGAASPQDNDGGAADQASEAAQGRPGEGGAPPSAGGSSTAASASRAPRFPSRVAGSTPPPLQWWWRGNSAVPLHGIVGGRRRPLQIQRTCSQLRERPSQGGAAAAAAAAARAPSVLSARPAGFKATRSIVLGF